MGVRQQSKHEPAAIRGVPAAPPADSARPGSRPPGASQAPDTSGAPVVVPVVVWLHGGARR